MRAVPPCTRILGSVRFWFTEHRTLLFVRRLDFKPSTGTEPSLSPTPGRKVGLGNISASAFLRVIACGCIVWFHTVPYGFLKDVGGIGLAIFLFFSFMYAGDHRDFSTALKRRSRRLLVP